MKVGELAAASVQYSERKGASAKKDNLDLVQRLSTIGTSGKHKQNCERDLQFAISTFAKALKADFFYVQCDLWDPAENAIVDTSLPVIDPVSLVAGLWKRGRHVFRHCFFGGLSEESVQAYWQNAFERGEWFQKHEASSWEPQKWARLAPISIYGDDVSSYKATEAGNISILTFCSDLAHGNIPFLRYFLLTLYSEYLATEMTYSAINETLLPCNLFFWWKGERKPTHAQ